MVSGWAGGKTVGPEGKVCPACISETVRCRKLILGREGHWLGGVGVQRYGVTLI